MSTKNDIPDTDLPTRLPSGKRKGSYLAKDTEGLERKRRQIEQDGERKLARVNAKEHSEKRSNATLDNENTMDEHPLLAIMQRFDGVEVDPPDHPLAKIDFENARREQEMEKQLRLGNMPKFSTAPKPQGS
ncbi:hypothetical protein [Legionella spiritensis]|uniref:hypothetical protein n=1 Tax=Legionella spiritensis TaxID=452 RepID=UPI000F6B4571|nr:hypothetical protein [Legionella spiritensis]VEG92342.1 putative Smr domain protein [Legionella spiritensis]